MNPRKSFFAEMESASPRSGFTLIEIMIVICIMGIIMAAGIPSVVHSLQKQPLAQAVNDLLEGCSNARAQAIMQGSPFALVIRAEDGQMNVRPAREKGARGESSGTIGLSMGAAAPAKASNFSARLHNDVAVTFLDVNFKNYMEASEAQVHFFPNGTSDEFTIILTSKEGGIKKISLDTVTALADIQTLR